MFRYFAGVWNAASRLECEAARRLRARPPQRSSQWQCMIEVPGFFVFCADAQRGLHCHRLSGNAGVVLGSLFERHHDLLDDAPCAHAQLDGAATQRLVESHGRSLIEHYWGNYVAFLYDSQSVTVLVSPAGRIPCLSSPIDNITCFYSRLTDALALGLPSPTPSHIYIRRRVLGQSPDSGNPLHEVTRLFRGEALRIQAQVHPLRIERRLLWNPHRFTQPDQQIDTPQRTAPAMRNVIRSCTQTLARDYDHVQLRLSGGLDSSIIAGCLRGTPAHVACHTYFTADTRADPRPWARLAAAHGGYPLAECTIHPEQLQLPHLACLRRSADAVSRLEYLARAQMERALCQKHVFCAVFTGDGGDAGFCSDCVALALTQHLHHHGLTRHTWNLARQVALATHRSHWYVLHQALRRRRHALPWVDPLHIDPLQMQLVAPDLMATRTTSLRHPWVGTDDNESQLTFYRLGLLVHPIDEFDLSVEADAPTPEIVHPLCAQPVVELLLRIPVYCHFEAGRDRGLARRAFAQDASAPNLERTWKDRAPGFLSQLIVQHVDWLRETLLEGILVKQRYLDRDKVAAALAFAPSRSSVNPAEIIRHLDVELWARQWQAG